MLMYLNTSGHVACGTESGWACRLRCLRFYFHNYWITADTSHENTFLLILSLPLSRMSLGYCFHNVRKCVISVSLPASCTVCLSSKNLTKKRWMVIHTSHSILIRKCHKVSSLCVVTLSVSFMSFVLEADPYAGSCWCTSAPPIFVNTGVHIIFTPVMSFTTNNCKHTCPPHGAAKPETPQIHLILIQSTAVSQCWGCILHRPMRTASFLGHRNNKAGLKCPDLVYRGFQWSVSLARPALVAVV